ncbi:MAG: SIS domain-containing protein [Chloroflexota bacterium]
MTESSGQRYLAIATALVARLRDEEWPRISAAADLLTRAIASGGVIHAFGSGHSHMLAEELFYRAGGLVRVRPILFEGLMLHASAPLSTTLERMPGLAAALLADHPMDAGDALVLASNSGRNAVTTELARLARDVGVRTIAITSLRHATSDAARVHGGQRLHELVDVAIDNGGAVGDAAVAIEGLDARVAPTSTVVGAAILEALVAEVAERLVARGIAPEVYASSNVAGGDAANDRYLRAGAGR